MPAADQQKTRSRGWNMAFLSNFAHLGFIQVSNAVIQILLFPLIILTTGLGKFGAVMVAFSVASLAGLVVNYGTGLSGIKDIALYKNDPAALSRIVSSVFFTRMLLSLLALALLPLAGVLGYDTEYLVLAIPVMLSETLNPLFFFTGIEKLFLYNIANLVSKLLAAASILLLIKTPEQAPWVNFYLGAFNVLSYTILGCIMIKKYALGRPVFNRKATGRLLKENFYLVGNNVSVQLQQSFFLFSIATMHDPLLLGAYSLCDKVVWSFRLLLTAFSGATFPRAVRLHEESRAQWQTYKRKTNRYLGAFFFLCGSGLLVLAPFITRVLTGGENALTITFIRAISFVPLVSAMNVLNVLDLLILNRYLDIFKIAVMLLGITIVVSLLLIRFSPAVYFGYYPLIIESCSISLYLCFIKKQKFHPND